MIPSARAAALRSTALATSLALAVGLSAFPVEAWAKPKVPLPKPRPIARNVVPRAPAATASDARRPQPCRGRRCRDGCARSCAARVLAPATRQHAALPPPRKQVAPAAVAATSSTSQADKDALENVIELVRKQKPGGRHAGAGRDIGSGRPQACGMADPAQRQQRRFGGALPRVRQQGIVEGGSTITQQFVKNAYIRNEQTIARKVREAALAWQLEQRWRRTGS